MEHSSEKSNLFGMSRRNLLCLFLVVACSSFVACSTCTLGSAMYSSCSTSVCNGLTAQLVQQLNSMGYTFTSMTTSNYTQYVHCSSPCQPYLQQSAAESLLKAAQSKNDYITLNSAYRSSAQQYLLYQWYLNGTCSVGLAAKPGQSDHEGGRSIDTSYYSYWKSTLQSNGWTWSYGSSDPYHFDYFAASDLSAKSLEAFQRLWNKNNPSEPLSTDGLYGPATANALYRAPCNGW